jgi:hypothetical protein
VHSNIIRNEEGRSMATIKAHTEYLTFHTDERYEMVHITPQVEEIVRRSGIEDGLCFVSPMHITAAIYVNDNGWRSWRRHGRDTSITAQARTMPMRT